MVNMFLEVSSTWEDQNGEVVDKSDKNRCFITLACSIKLLPTVSLRLLISSIYKAEKNPKKLPTATKNYPQVFLK